MNDYILSYMRISKLYLILLLLLVVACGDRFGYSDLSTDATHPLSELTIESGINSVYNIAKNEKIVINPVISQSGKEKELSYTWEIDLKEVSYDATFTFEGEALGKYNCRFIVENEDGKTFFPFTVFVNSPYEEGITILSKDAKGNSMISFMQKPLEGEKGAFAAGDCFTVNNPDENFAAGAVDIVQCRDESINSGWVIVACNGGGENGDLPTIYYLNEKTFEVENKFTVAEFDVDKPLMFGIPPIVYPQTSYPVLCENGKVYDFSIGEADVIQPRKLQSTYDKSCIVNTAPTSYEILLWDKVNKGLALIYNGYGPYYCSKEYHLMLTDEKFKSLNRYNGRDLMMMTKIRMTDDQLNVTARRNEFLIITQSVFQTISEVLYTDFWGYDFVESAYTFEVANTHTQNSKLTGPVGVETPCIANKTYNTLLFADGNKVRVWNYAALPNDLSKLMDAKTLYTIESEDAVITGFEISDDHKKTYVAYYEPNSDKELNGSLVVIDTDKGTLIEEFKNISYQPVKMIYKKK